MLHSTLLCIHLLKYRRAEVGPSFGISDVLPDEADADADRALSETVMQRDHRDMAVGPTP